MNLSLISIMILIFICGYLIGYNQREIMEMLSRISALINVKNNSAVIRGREVIKPTEMHTNKETAQKVAGIIRPKSPKEVARDSANKFMDDFNL